jgi:cytidyltransferase-like protein
VFPVVRVSPRLVLTIGTFDILHFGHVAFLQQCAALGDRLVVGINTDRFVREFKPAPIMSERERILALHLLGYETRLNDSAGKEMVAEFHPDVLAIGTDWAPGRGKDYLAQVGVTQDWLDAQGVILAWVPYRQSLSISTTEIRRRVLEAGRG